MRGEDSSGRGEMMKEGQSESARSGGGGESSNGRPRTAYHELGDRHKS